jgi:ABC-type lipoprotein release transport system permease subunit
VVFVASNYVEGYVYGLKSNDALTIVEAVAILLLSATAAAILPAHRASRINPTIALRHE